VKLGLGGERRHPTFEILVDDAEPLLVLLA
jgi:hypothetical protein